MAADFLIYGANGYTGALILEQAVRRGFRPLIAGRSRGPIKDLGARFNLQWRAFSLADSHEMVSALREVPLLLHCAGPFVDTAAPMAQACLETGTHYVDITGEILVIEYLAGLDDRARQVGVLFSPGMGFDVVPGDCIARTLQLELPTATQLSLGFEASVRPSRGTMRSAILRAHQAGLVRQEGELQEIRAGSLSREIDFGGGPRHAVAIPWGDLAAAYHSTGIRNIITYMAAPSALVHLLTLSQLLKPLMARRWIRRQISRIVRLLPSGPDEGQRERGHTRYWGQVQDPKGRAVEARMGAPEAYTLTVEAVLAAATRVLAGEAEPGFNTPAMAFGEDFVTSLPGVSWLGMEKSEGTLSGA